MPFALTERMRLEDSRKVLARRHSCPTCPPSRLPAFMLYSESPRFQDHLSFNQSTALDLRRPSLNSDIESPKLNNDFESPQRFAEIVSPHLPRLVSTARGILGSEDLAWDAVQETLIRLWGRGWLPPEPAGTLIYLVKKSSLHILRCQRRRADREFASGDRSACCEDDPAASLDSAERVSLVRKVVRGIAEEYRVVLELFEFQGESYESIANRLSLPLGTVRSRLSRGRSIIRERLLSECSEGPIA